MTWANRLRLYGGLILVLGVVAALVLVFNQRQSQAVSVSAHIATDRATVGAAYGGVVTRQYVQAGDSVTKGQDLFTVVSPVVRQDALQGVTLAATPAFHVNTADSTVTYTALTSGVLKDVNAPEGGYVQGGGDLATITAVGSQYAVADFVLSPQDYARIQHGARVDLLLPNDQTVQGRVEDVSVQTQGTHAMTKVTVASPALHAPGLSRLAQPGTPVTATLYLRNDGPLAGPTDALIRFLRRIGLK